jgi:hypothetical protein
MDCDSTTTATTPFVSSQATGLTATTTTTTTVVVDSVAAATSGIMTRKRRSNAINQSSSNSSASSSGVVVLHKTSELASTVVDDVTSGTGVVETRPFSVPSPGADNDTTTTPLVKVNESGEGFQLSERRLTPIAALVENVCSGKQQHLLDDVDMPEHESLALAVADIAAETAITVVVTNAEIVSQSQQSGSVEMMDGDQWRKNSAAERSEANAAVQGEISVMSGSNASQQSADATIAMVSNSDSQQQQPQQPPPLVNCIRKFIEIRNQVSKIDCLDS